MYKPGLAEFPVAFHGMLCSKAYATLKACVRCGCCREGGEAVCRKQCRGVNPQRDAAQGGAVR